jgi:hypothetical protein
MTKIMTTTPRPSAIEAAKQGHPKAIEVLLNQALQSHCHTAKVIRNEAALRILIEGEDLPDEVAIVDLIENGLRQLSLDAITPDVQIYGQRRGESLPQWTRSLDLSPSTAPPIFDFDAVTVDLPAAAPIKPVVEPPPRSMTPIGPPEKPPTYTAFAVVMFFLGIFPLTWVGVILCSQVSSQYKQGDYDGAEIASQRTKFWCQMNLWISIPIYVLAGGVILLGAMLETSASKVQPTPEEKVVVQRLQAMMEAERRFWVETDKLSPTITMPEDNSTAAMVAPYRYTVTMLDSQRVQVTAVPTRKGLHSFTAGIMMLGPADDVGPESVICRSAKPLMKAVPMPTPIHGGRSATCGPESKVVDSTLGVGDDVFTPQPSEESYE